MMSDDGRAEHNKGERCLPPLLRNAVRYAKYLRPPSLRLPVNSRQFGKVGVARGILRSFLDP